MSPHDALAAASKEPALTDILTERRGPGRWTNVHKPVTGVLWTNESVVGFEPAPTPDNDPQAVLDAIAATSGTATKVFDILAAQFGMTIAEGELDRWTARQKRRG
ncbi:hypothetical protein [Williamsia sp.]|uniref:hypothetical protein n=1 Tax=Williamsia sp. TaxID=1872085 RepID=UPI002F943C15